MTDELEHLKGALKAAQPAPDAGRRAEALAAAMQAFDANRATLPQEIEPHLRPMSDRPDRAGILTGVRMMLSNLSSRGALAATASAAALGLALVVVMPTLKAPVTPHAPVRPQTGTPAPAGIDVSPQVVPQVVPKIAPPAPVANEVAPATPVAPVTGGSVATVPRDDAATTATTTTAGAISEQVNQALKSDSEASGRLSGAARAKLAPPPSPSSAPLDALQDGTTARAEADAAISGMAQGVQGEMAPVMAEPAPAFSDMPAYQPEPNTEAYPEAKANPVHITAEDPVSTFSIDVDTASYAVIRSSLMRGELPPKEAVRIEEMVNYFPYHYPAPKAGEAPFKPTVSVVQTPWNPDTRLVHIAVQGRMPATADRPPLNLVFLIDTSGSMDDPEKLPLLKQSFRLMLGQLRAEDRIAIVTYAGSAGEVLAPTPASDQAKILAALENLSAGGSTAGQEGLQQAYAVADSMKKDGTVTRVLLATDGDFNVGISDPGQLKDFIARERKSGTYLSVLGFGRGNLDDATMQALAQNGNGTAAYIDTLGEAQKVLVDQLTGALFPIADDVKIQMEFNPAVISEYRLIGYETRALNREDFNNDKVDAGEIGAGTSVTALYEVTPVGSPAQHADPLRYQTAAPQPEKAPEDAELGFLKLRYKDPGTTTSRLISLAVAPAPTRADDDTRFAIAIAGFGQLLTGATYLNDWGWDDAIALANGARGDDPFGYRTEAVQIMRLAMSLSH